MSDLELANIAAAQEIEPLTLEEAQNLAAYFASVNAEIERARAISPGTPINEDYCWMHNDVPGGGGWCCVVCREEEQS
jgi:hypothetical protein